MGIARWGLWERLITCLVAVLMLVAALPTPALAAPEEEWTRRFGTEQADEVFALAVGPQGVYVGGGIARESHYAVTRAFLHKYEHNGELAWTKWYDPPKGHDGRTWIGAIAVDATGVYAGGSIDQVSGDDRVTFGLLRKYSHNGSLLWERRIGSREARETWVTAAAADPSGLYVAITSEWGDFLRKYSQRGDLLWTREISGHGTGVDLGAGGVYVSGVHQFGETGYIVDPTLDRFTRDGRHVWSRRWGSPEVQDFAHGVAVGGEDVYVVGSPSKRGSEGAYVRKYGADGRMRWTRRSNCAGDVDADASGAYLVGDCMRKYRSNGSVAWTRPFGDTYNVSDEHIRLWAAGDKPQSSEPTLYVAGQVQEPPTEQNQGLTDGYLRKYSQGDSMPVVMPDTGGGGSARP
ncbi:MAG: hypothetical protein M3P51_18725, partial [Chloroflexota bacterium]|nr:hypothetical protein [Chloroflexota bacterium]